MTHAEACALFAKQTAAWLETASEENVKRSWKLATDEFKRAIWAHASRKLKVEIKRISA